MEGKGDWIVGPFLPLTPTFATDPKTAGGFSFPLETILCLPGRPGQLLLRDSAELEALASPKSPPCLDLDSESGH